MKEIAVCVSPYSYIRVGDEFEIIENHQKNTFLLRNESGHRILAPEYYKGIKIFKTKEEIREEKLNNILLGNI